MLGVHPGDPPPNDNATVPADAATTTTAGKHRPRRESIETMRDAKQRRRAGQSALMEKFFGVTSARATPARPASLPEAAPNGATADLGAAASPRDVGLGLSPAPVQPTIAAFFTTTPTAPATLSNALNPPRPYLRPSTAALAEPAALISEWTGAPVDADALAKRPWQYSVNGLGPSDWAVPYVATFWHEFGPHVALRPGPFAASDLDAALDADGDEVQPLLLKLLQALLAPVGASLSPKRHVTRASVVASADWLLARAANNPQSLPRALAHALRPLAPAATFAALLRPQRARLLQCLVDWHLAENPAVKAAAAERRVRHPIGRDDADTLYYRVDGGDSPRIDVEQFFWTLSGGARVAVSQWRTACATLEELDALRDALAARAAAAPSHADLGALRRALDYYAARARAAHDAEEARKARQAALVLQQQQRSDAARQARLLRQSRRSSVSETVAPTRRSARVLTHSRGGALSGKESTTGESSDGESTPGESRESTAGESSDGESTDEEPSDRESPERNGPKPKSNSNAEASSDGEWGESSSTLSASSGASSAASSPGSSP